MHISEGCEAWKRWEIHYIFQPPSTIITTISRHLQWLRSCECIQAIRAASATASTVAPSAMGLIPKGSLPLGTRWLIEVENSHPARVKPNRRHPCGWQGGPRWTVSRCWQGERRRSCRGSHLAECGQMCWRKKDLIMFECRHLCAVNVFNAEGLNFGKYTLGHSYYRKHFRLCFHLSAHTYISNVTLSSANFADCWSKDIFFLSKKQKKTKTMNIKIVQGQIKVMSASILV